VPPSSDDTLVLRARPVGVVVQASVVLVACVLIALFSPEARVWCLLGAIGALIWAPWRLRRTERFRADLTRCLLEYPSAAPLNLRAIREIVVKEPEQEAPTIATVMVDLGQAKWIPVYFGHPDAADQVARFVRRAVERLPSEQESTTAVVAATPAPGAAAPTRLRVETARGVYQVALSARRAKSLPERVILVTRHFDDSPGEALGEGCGRYLAMLQRFERSGPPPRPWVAITRDAAKSTLAEALGRELAYGYELLQVAEREGLADDFLRLFSKDLEYFGVPPHVRIGVSAQFDSGIVVRHRDGVALCWVESDSPGR